VKALFADRRAYRKKNINSGHLAKTCVVHTKRTNKKVGSRLLYFGAMHFGPMGKCDMLTPGMKEARYCWKCGRNNPHGLVRTDASVTCGDFLTEEGSRNTRQNLR
jgi:hypothetical protein